MSKMILSRETAAQATLPSGRPDVHMNSKQPVVERQMSDPSSCSPKGERYPIPAFFEYRVKAREYDPL